MNNLEGKVRQLFHCTPREAVEKRRLTEIVRGAGYAADFAVRANRRVGSVVFITAYGDGTGRIEIGGGGDERSFGGIDVPLVAAFAAAERWLATGEET